MLITLTATIPVLLLRIWKPSGLRLKVVLWYFHIIVAANILWTLTVGAESDVEKVNAVVAVLLVIALLVKILALRACNSPLGALDEIGLMVVNTETPALLLSYTIWNIVFATYFISFSMCFQIFATWPVTFYFQRLHRSHSLGAYFFAARAVSLGFWSAMQTWSELIPPFKQCPADPQWNQHDFVAFICYVNIVSICTGIMWEVRCVFCGRGQQPEPERGDAIVTTLSKEQA